jgi:hypothetical protein
MTSSDRARGSSSGPFSLRATIARRSADLRIAPRICVLTLGLLLAATPSTAQPSVHDRLIVPGERIGPWRLPLTLNRLLAMNGPRQGAQGGADVILLVDGDLAGTFWVHRWDHLHLRAVTPGRRAVEPVFNLFIFGKEYRTAEGIGPGASRAAVEAAYGSPTAVTVPAPRFTNLIYDRLGLAVRLDQQGTAVAVLIFRPGTARQRWKY